MYNEPFPTNTKIPQNKQLKLNNPKQSKNKQTIKRISLNNKLVHSMSKILNFDYILKEWFGFTHRWQQCCRYSFCRMNKQQITILHVATNQWNTSHSYLQIINNLILQSIIKPVNKFACSSLNSFILWIANSRFNTKVQKRVSINRRFI
jgi:hypothetical protein